MNRPKFFERARVAYCKFRGIPSLSPEEVLRKIRSGLADGTMRVEYDHPDAEGCFPLASDSEDSLGAGDFSYLKMEVLKPFKPRIWKHSSVKAAAHDGGLHFQWGVKGFGFGDGSIVFRDGRWTCDAETLGKDFVKKALSLWVDSMEIR